MVETEAEYWAALKLMDEGNFDEAAQKLADLVAAVSDARMFAAYGICQQQRGLWVKSIGLFNRALDLKPAYCEADWRNMLATSYLKTGDVQNALAQWRMVARLQPTYPSHNTPIDEAKQMLKDHSG